ncbi:MAG: RNase H family protein, partial [Tabrizicola sp.]
MAELFAYTDGACSGNPGPGGWGVLMIAYENGAVVKERELQGGEPLTTNNRMELLAAISAL